MRLTSILLAAAVVFGAAIPAQAKTKEEVRIYINPGHGGWGSGDRHMGTIKHGAADYSDTTGFFETNTNMWKGLACLQRLSEYGFKYDPTLNQCPEGVTDTEYRYGAARDLKNQGLVMSHVKNGVSRNINDIAEEVEMNNFDFFISIHSNANKEGDNTNYPALFVRGENKTESVTGSVAACKAIWPYAYSNTHSCWSNYSMNQPAVYYDIDFWSGDYLVTTHPNGNVCKGYYAVLRHTVPGLLCEGYFHTYQPARHRAMNHDVCRIEGESYARGIADIFGVEHEKTGDIYGIVRDAHERFSHQFYHCSSASADAFKPLNNVTVKLYDAQGKEVSTYVTDDEWNGAFVFRKLPVGTYTIKVSAEGYKEAAPEYCGPFEVKAATVLYPKVSLESVNYVPPTVVYRDYEDVIDTKAIQAGSRYAFRQAVADKEIAALADKTVKRMIVKGDNVYVLAHDAKKAPTVVVLDAATLDVKAEVSTEGTEGTESPLADIAVTSDGVLIGSAGELCHITEDQVEAGETFGECNIYKWANDDNGVPAGAPQKWMGLSITANFYRAYTGFTIAYTGTSTEGQLIIPSASTYYNKKVWLNVVDVVDGVKASTRFVNQTRDLMNMDDLGDDVTFTVSPLDSNSFIVNSSKVQPMQFSNVDYTLQTTTPKSELDANVAREGFFKYAGHSMMAVGDLDKDGANGGVRLLDVTSGINRPAAVVTSNTSVEAAAGVSATAGRTTIVRDGDDVITAANMDLYTLRGNKASRFTTQGTEQPKVRGNWAYALRQTVSGDEAELTFSLTDASDASVVLTPVKGGEEVTAATGAFDKGANSVKVDLSKLSGEYNWKVVVENEAVPAATTIFDSGVVSSGVAIDLNPDSENFGTAYVSQKDGKRGIRVFTPDLQGVNAAPYLAGKWDTSVGASPWRLAVLPTGKLIITDWGDAQGGMYLWNPAVTDRRDNFFAGTCNSSSGEWTYNGAVIGGSTSGVAVTGSGSDTRLIAFEEDWPSDYKLNLVTYDLGEKEQIDFQPTQSDAFKTLSGMLINGNVDVLVREKGMAFGQVRGSGNNAPGVPSFVITDPAGEVLFNSGSDMADLTGSSGCIAMSADGTQFIVQDAGAKMHVCSLTWEPEFKLTEDYTFPIVESGQTVDTYQAAYDPAGNVYFANRTSFRVVSLPRPASQAVTPAASTLVLKGTDSAVEDIVADTDSNAPVRYYNLQGVQLDGDNLPAGVYIRQQGKKATKVVIR